MKIKKGDEVKVIRGKDKGKTAKVERVFPKEKKALVAGVNLFKRHRKARSANQQSEIITLTKPISLANLALICPKCHTSTRVGYVLDKDGKHRVCKECDQNI